MKAQKGLNMTKLHKLYNLTEISKIAQHFIETSKDQDGLRTILYGFIDYMDSLNK